MRTSVNLLLAAAAVAAVVPLGAVAQVKELGDSTLRVVQRRSEVLLVQYHDPPTPPSKDALRSTLEAVSKSVSAGGHTAGGACAVARVDVNEWPSSGQVAVADGATSLPALLLYVKTGEAETETEVLCVGDTECAALSAATIYAQLEEKLDVRAAVTGSNTTVPTIEECEAVLAEGLALLEQEGAKKPLPANGTRALCSDSTNCGDCRLAGCGWCRISQLCVVDLPNNCHGQMDHIGANGFSESCADVECNSTSCCAPLRPLDLAQVFQYIGS